MSAARMVTWRSGEAPAASTSFFVARSASDLVVEVRIRPVAPACAKALAVAAPILRLAPVMATTKGDGSFWLDGARDAGGVLLSLVVKVKPVQGGGAAIVQEGGVYTLMWFGAACCPIL